MLFNMLWVGTLGHEKWYHGNVKFFFWGDFMGNEKLTYITLISMLKH